MTTTHDLPSGAPASPVDEGRLLAGRWTVGARFERRGDVHLHRGVGSAIERSAPGPVAIAAWRYRGFEPLPRFLVQLGRDLEAWASVRHPAVLTTLDIGREVGETTCFWVVDAPGGVWLAEHLSVPGTVDAGRAVTIALAVGDALAAVHGEGLVHGDVCARSVLYDAHTGRVRIGWGGMLPRLARAGVDLGHGEEDGDAGGAPELAGGASASASTDVYGLAALLYEMLHDRPPFALFRSGSAPGTAHGEPLAALDPDLPDDLADLLERGLRRDPDLRPSLRAFVDRLGDLAPDLGATVVEWSQTPPPLADRTPPTVHRTIEPSGTHHDADPALVNTPTSAGARLGLPTPVSLARSVVPFTDVSNDFLNPAPPEPNRLQQVLVGVVLLLAIAVSAMTMLVLSRQGAAPVQAVVANPAPAPVPAPVVVPAPPSLLTLRTEPPGAEVWEGDTKLGVTPLELPFGTDATAPTRRLELRAAGHATHTIELPWSPVSVQHTVALQRERVRPYTSPDLDLREER